MVLISILFIHLITSIASLLVALIKNISFQSIHSKLMDIII